MVNLAPNATCVQNAVTVSGKASGGSGSAIGCLSMSGGISMSADTTLYIADQLNSRIVVVNHTSLTIIRNIGSGPGASSNQFNACTCLCAVGTSIYVLDTSNLHSGFMNHEKILFYLSTMVISWTRWWKRRKFHLSGLFSVECFFGIDWTCSSGFKLSTDARISLCFIKKAYHRHDVEYLILSVRRYQQSSHFVDDILHRPISFQQRVGLEFCISLRKSFLFNVRHFRLSLVLLSMYWSLFRVRY